MIPSHPVDPGVGPSTRSTGTVRTGDIIFGTELIRDGLGAPGVIRFVQGSIIGHVHQMFDQFAGGGKIIDVDDGMVRDVLFDIGGTVVDGYRPYFEWTP